MLQLHHSLELSNYLNTYKSSIKGGYYGIHYESIDEFQCHVNYYHIQITYQTLFFTLSSIYEFKVEYSNP